MGRESLMSSSSSSHVRIQLAPKAGFCIKTTTLAPAVLPPAPSPPKPAAATANERLEPPPGPIPVPQGRKVFVNIAWDANVPPPPEGTDEDVRRAMEGTDGPADAQDGGWYVPVIVSHAREDADKAGKPSLLFDCVYNSGVKARTLRDPEFKVFLVELALQRIEAQTGLALARTIATPNIASKGKLLPRTVTIPSSLLRQNKPEPVHPPVDPETAFANIAPSESKSESASGTTKRAPLIQEISDGTLDKEPAAATKSAKPSKSADTALPGLRGILKKPTAPPKGTADPAPPNGLDADPLVPLEWDWGKDDDGRLRIVIKVSGLTAPLVRAAELDVGPRRVALRIPHRAPLDIDLAPSDAEIVSRAAGAYAAAAEALAARAKAGERGALQVDAERLEARRQAAGARALMLKRQRDFEVEKADAEWRVGEGEVVVYV